MSNQLHIAREKRAGEKLEALCGIKAMPDQALACGPDGMSTCWRCITLRCARPLPAEPKVPEHDRLNKAKKTDDATQLVGEFFEWLECEKRIVLAQWDGSRNGNEFLVPTYANRNNLLAEFFGVSENALESEKQALLEFMRATNKAVAWAETEGREILRARNARS